MTNNFVFIRNYLPFAIQAYPGGKSNQLCRTGGNLTIVRVAIWFVECIVECAMAVGTLVWPQKAKHTTNASPHHMKLLVVCVYCHLSNSISCGSSVKILIRPHLFDDDCFPCSKCFPIIYLSKYAKTIFSLKMNYTVDARRTYASII